MKGVRLLPVGFTDALEPKAVEVLKGILRRMSCEGFFSTGATATGKLTDGSPCSIPFLITVTIGKECVQEMVAASKDLMRDGVQIERGNPPPGLK